MLLGNKSHTVEQPIQQFYIMGMLETGYDVYIPRRRHHKDLFPHSVTLWPHGAAGRSGLCALVSATCTLGPEHTAVESQGQSMEKMWRTLC